MVYSRHEFPPLMLQLLFEGEASSRRDLQAMRERHKQRFVEATAQLRSRHKAMAKRVRALEMQLSRNSVSWQSITTTVK